MPNVTFGVFAQIASDLPQGEKKGAPCRIPGGAKNAERMLNIRGAIFNRTRSGQA